MEDESSLESYLSGFDPAELDPDAPEKFKVEDDASAEWAMKKLRQLRRRQRTNSEIAEEEARRLQEWLDAVNKPINQSALFFEGLLIDYAMRCRENSEDQRKTISLPAGKIATRSPAPKWDIDAEVFLPWARLNNPELIRVKEEPALQVIKDEFAGFPVVSHESIVFTEDGEIVPGIIVREQDISITITPDLN